MKIAICTPIRNGYVHARHMAAFAEASVEAQKYGAELHRYTLSGSSYLQVVRNMLARDALNDGCDWICFVDDDIAYKGSDLFKLLSHGAPVIGAAPAGRHLRWDQKPSVMVRLASISPTNPTPAPIAQHQTPAGRVWEVQAVPTAFIGIAAHVFNKIEPKTRLMYVNTLAEPVRTYFWFDIVEVNGKPTFEGEDYNFCRKWREIGGKIYLDPDIRLEHYDGNVCHDYSAADMERDFGATRE